MKNLLFALLITFVGFTAKAQEKKNKNASYTIEVNGNCEQCQKRIQKASFSVAGVKSAVWDVDNHRLTLILNEEKCTALDVQKAVAKAGHDTGDIKATDDAYNNLHHCCQYDRK